MQPTDIIFPVLVQAGLTFVLLFRMAHLRISALRNREVSIPDIALGQRAWPDEAAKASNAFHNQLELPVLFFVLVALALITQQVDTVMILLAWIFVISRIWHAWIHSTYNDVKTRFYVYAAGAVVLAVMWGFFAIRFIVATL